MTTRLMGDATHDNVPELAKVLGLQLAAGYVTGDTHIRWTAADWAKFPGLPAVTIDQGFTGSPVATATVRDVEFGAWNVPDAVNRKAWTAVRPTIYCTLGETGRALADVLAAGWKGDLWLAIPGWTPAQALPSAPGCTIVAVQDNYNQPAYDLSTVLDPYWPSEAPMELPVKKLPAPPVTIEANTATLDVTGRNGGRYVMVWDQATDKWREVAWPVA